MCIMSIEKDRIIVRVEVAFNLFEISIGIIKYKKASKNYISLVRAPYQIR